MKTSLFTLLTLLLLIACSQALAGPGSFRATTAALSATATVLDIVGLPEADARYYLGSTALTVGTVSTAHHDAITAGSVISQSLVSGSVTVIGSSVDLVVSLGPAPVNVPNVVGLAQTAAAPAITTAGLTVGDIILENNATVTAGSVINQSPPAGASAAPGNSVLLTVSLGPLPTGIPSSLLSDAYKAVTSGFSIRARDPAFTGNLDLADSKSVFLRGGNANTGATVLNGVLKINAGTLTAEKIIIRSSPPISVPGSPTGVKVTAGATVGTTASVSFTAPAYNGGSQITGYTVTVTPGGATVTDAASPISIAGLTPGTAYTFSVVASNVAGDSTLATAKNINNYDVVETFLEPQTQPRDSIFRGTFTYDSITQSVTNLQGLLSESMSGDPIAYPTYDYHMAWLSLTHQLSSQPVTLGGANGLLVTTFKNANTNTFWTGLGGDGWSPKSGVDAGGVYYGFPKAANNPGNAYAMIFVNTADPTAQVAQAQIDKLAYADCTPLSGPGGINGGGMMGAVCMTGTTVAGYGSVGTMSGYPLSQVITIKP